MSELCVSLRETASFLDAQRVVGDMMEFNTACDMELDMTPYGKVVARATWDVPVERVADFVHARSTPAILSIVAGGRQLA